MFVNVFYFFIKNAFLTFFFILRSTFFTSMLLATIFCSAQWAEALQQLNPAFRGQQSSKLTTSGRLFLKFVAMLKEVGWRLPLRQIDWRGVGYPNPLPTVLFNAAALVRVSLAAAGHTSLPDWFSSAAALYPNPSTCLLCDIHPLCLCLFLCLCGAVSVVCAYRCECACVCV